MPFIVGLVYKAESLQKKNCIQVCLTEENLTEGLFTGVQLVLKQNGTVKHNSGKLVALLSLKGKRRECCYPEPSQSYSLKELWS